MPKATARGARSTRSAPSRPSRRSKRSPVKFEGVTPILRVSNVSASVDHYVEVLGFREDWRDENAGFASVSRGRSHLFLAEGDQGHPGSWTYVGVSDAGALHEEYRRRGARIRHAPTNYSWAYEMQVEDPDGNVLRMGSEPVRGRPAGEWLDMEGRRWIRTAAGWTRKR